MYFFTFPLFSTQRSTQRSTQLHSRPVGRATIAHSADPGNSIAFPRHIILIVPIGGSSASSVSALDCYDGVQPRTACTRHATLTVSHLDAIIRARVFSLLISLSLGAQRARNGGPLAGSSLGPVSCTCRPTIDAPLRVDRRGFSIPDTCQRAFRSRRRPTLRRVQLCITLSRSLSLPGVERSFALSAEENEDDE